MAHKTAPVICTDLNQLALCRKENTTYINSVIKSLNYQTHILHGSLSLNPKGKGTVQSQPNAVKTHL